MKLRIMLLITIILTMLVFIQDTNTPLLITKPSESHISFMPPLPYNPEEQLSTRQVTRIQPVSGTSDSYAPLPREGVYGNHPILVAMVEFRDRRFNNNFNKRTVEDLLFGYGLSLKKYYEENSYNQFTIHGTVVDDIMIDESILDYRFYAGYPNEKIKELIKKIYLEAASRVNISEFDLFHTSGKEGADGVVDHFLIIFPTRNRPWIVDRDIWPHRSGIYPLNAEYNNKELVSYMIVGDIFPLGTYVHEFGHDLGLPDLYDVDFTSHGGVGEWCVMAEGSFMGDEMGNYPCHLSPWAKIKLGWIIPQIITRSVPQLNLKNIEDYPDIIKIPIASYNSPEYFLVENRLKRGFNSYVNDAGILIWHINERQQANNNDRNRLVDVEESSTHQDLDYGPYVQIDVDDYRDTFKRRGNTVFDADSNPNSHSNDGADSMISIEVVSNPGREMTLAVDCPSIGNIEAPTIVISNEDFNEGEFNYYPMYNDTEQIVKLNAPSTGVTLKTINMFLINYSGNQNQTRINVRVYKDDNGDPGDILYSKLFLELPSNTNPPYTWYDIEIEDQSTVYIPSNESFWIGIEYKSEQRDTGIALCGKPSSVATQTSYVKMSQNDTRLRNFSDIHYIVRAEGYAGQHSVDVVDLGVATPEDMLVQQLREADYLTDTDQFQEAAEIYRETLSLMQSNPSYYSHYIPVALNSLGYNEFKAGRMDRAITSFLQTYSLIKNSADSRTLAALNANIGETYYHLNEFDKAYEYYYNSYRINTELSQLDDRSRQLLEDNYFLGMIRFKQNQNEEAMEYLEAALPLAQMLSQNPEVAELNREELILETMDIIEGR